MRRIVSTETELSIAPVDNRPDAARRGREDLAPALLALAAERLPHVRHGPGNLFLGNGARVYIDTGSHLEYAAPETTTPAEAVCHVLAGEAILRDLVTVYNQRHPEESRIALFKTNVDYSGSMATYGCHENYGHQGAVSHMPDQLIPHLCSRVILTGAGGFHVGKPLAFTLSPRVAHLHAKIGDNTTGNRAIYNTRHEPLGEGKYRRLHVICGESQCSHLGMYLKAGTTALVVALAEQGLDPGNSVMPVDPLDAMRRFVADPTCRVAVPVQGSSRRLRALDIQRHYLQVARRHRSRSAMPAWTGSFLAAWAAALDRIEAGAPASVATTLDWGIKYRLYADQCRRRGFALDDEQRWATLLGQALGQASGQGATAGASAEAADGAAAVTGRRRRRRSAGPLGRLARRPGRALTEAEALRLQLFEIDTKYAQLGAEGLFAQLEDLDQLDHRVPEISDEAIRRAMVEPPADTRARFRGGTIQRLWERGRSPRYMADWTGVWRPEGTRQLDLRDPFVERPRWRPCGRRDPVGHLPPGLLMREVTRRYRQGRYESAARLLDDFPPEEAALVWPTAHSELCRIHARLQCRRGLADAAHLLDAVHDATTEPAVRIIDHLYLHRFRGLVPAETMRPWVEDALRLDEGAWGRWGGERHEHLAAWYLGQGSLEDAHHQLQQLLRLEAEDTIPWRELPRRRMRALGMMAEVCRRMGRIEPGHRHLAEAERGRAGSRPLADDLDFVRTTRARLAEDAEQRQAILAEIMAVQKMNRDAVGQLRTRLLTVRGVGSGAPAAAARQFVRRACQRRPVLAACPRLVHVLAHWSDWVSGRGTDVTDDDFWGL